MKIIKFCENKQCPKREVCVKNQYLFFSCKLKNEFKNTTEFQRKILLNLL